MKHKTRRILAYLLMAAILLTTTSYSMQTMYGADDMEFQIPPRDCGIYPGKFKDYCLYKTAQFAESRDLNYSIQNCLNITKENVRGHCTTDLAMFFIIDRQGITDGKNTVQDICERLDAGVWNSECFFKSAELAASLYENYAGAYTLCAQSMDFEYDCIGHLEELIHNKNPAMAHQFCQKVEEDYANISDIPAIYCFNHYGLRLGAAGEKDPCKLVQQCPAQAKYWSACVRGILSNYGDTHAACSCTKVTESFKEVCIK